MKRQIRTSKAVLFCEIAQENSSMKCQYLPVGITPGEAAADLAPTIHTGLAVGVLAPHNAAPPLVRAQV
jgi:hypothetical protein